MEYRPCPLQKKPQEIRYNKRYLLHHSPAPLPTMACTIGTCNRTVGERLKRLPGRPNLRSNAGYLPRRKPTVRLPSLSLIWGAALRQVWTSPLIWYGHKSGPGLLHLSALDAGSSIRAPALGAEAIAY